MNVLKAAFSIVARAKSEERFEGLVPGTRHIGDFQLTREKCALRRH